MRKMDVIFVVGLGLMFVGFALVGNYGLWRQAQAFAATAAAHGQADPAALARQTAEALRYTAIGQPIGWVGICMVVYAFRGYLLARRPPAAAAEPTGSTPP